MDQVVKKQWEIMVRPDLVGIAFYLLPDLQIGRLQETFSGRTLLHERYMHGPRKCRQFVAPTYGPV